MATRELVITTLFTLPDLEHASKTFLAPSTAGTMISSSVFGAELGNGEAT